MEDPPSVLTDFKQQLYGGKSLATELVRRGYVVITIDMFYWGERRMLLDDDPPSYREPRLMTKDEVAAFNRRSQQAEQLVARSLFAAGITWPGVILWDDLRTLDYLATRPEVDARRLGCVGVLVINGSKDQLFPPEAVAAAFRKIDQCFRKAGVPERQRCRLYEAPHRFDALMRADAWEWLGRAL